MIHYINYFLYAFYLAANILLSDKGEVKIGNFYMSIGQIDYCRQKESSFLVPEHQINWISPNPAPDRRISLKLELKPVLALRLSLNGIKANAYLVRILMCLVHNGP